MTIDWLTNSLIVNTSKYKLINDSQNMYLQFLERIVDKSYLGSRHSYAGTFLSLPNPLSKVSHF